MTDDTITKVLRDYKKIAENHDWLPESKSAVGAIADYAKTLKDLVEAEKYSQQAAMLVESMVSEIDESRKYIAVMEEEVAYLNDLIVHLMNRIDGVDDDDEQEGTPEG